MNILENNENSKEINVFPICVSLLEFESNEAEKGYKIEKNGIFMNDLANLKV